FDGETWTVYNTRNSELPSDSLHSGLVFDGQGNLWIGTERGLAKFDGETWMVYNEVNSGLPDDFIWILLIDTQGNTWIGTYFGGLAVYREGGVILPGEVIASKVEDLVGVWETRFMGVVAYMQFEADGTLTLARTVEKLESAPILSGTFWFEGTVFNMEDTLAYHTGKYEVRGQKEGDKPIYLTFIVIDDPDPDRVRDLTAGMSRGEP
ncbi:MAG: two-component regulator propeller domain-containing protein, partial [Anaerolineae bacterium]